MILARRYARWLWPRTLFGRLTLILLVGLVMAHSLSYALLLYQHTQASKGMMLYSLGKDVASAVAILERVPAAERPLWLARLERRSYRFQLGQSNKGAPVKLPLAGAVDSVVRNALGKDYDVLTTVAPQPGLRRLDIHVRLSDGTPLTLLLTPMPVKLAPPVPWIIGMQFIVVSIFIWFSVRLATLPLAQLAHAADQLGPDANSTWDDMGSARLPLDGPLEVAKAAAAFYGMQMRITEFLAERMHILAAVSHDLQTPITRMRLRADLMDDADERDKMLADLQTMQSLVEEGITYARNAHGIVEPACRINLDALLASLVYEYIDAGESVQLSGATTLTPLTRPHALRRIITNLINNALKFGAQVEVRLTSLMDHGFVIEVLDRGPGIPQDQLNAVLQPFYRLEKSRNRDTGGAGLGLAIAHQLAGALGGKLTLHNRKRGGLRVKLALPLVTDDLVSS